MNFKIENWDFPTEFTSEKAETSVPTKERPKAHYKQNDHVEMKPSESVVSVFQTFYLLSPLIK